MGHYSLTMAVAMLLGSLLGGGMGVAAVPPLRQDRLPAGRMLKAQLLWAGSMILIMLFLAAGTLNGQTAAFFRDHLGWFPGLGFAAVIAAASILGFEIFSYDLLARGRLVVSAAINGYRAMAHLAAIGLLWAFDELDFARVVGVFAVAQLGGAVAALITLLRDIRKRSHPEPVKQGMAPEDLPADLERRSLMGLIRFNLMRGWVGQLSAVAYFLLLRLDQMLLEHFKGAAEVGIYSVGVHVGEMLWLLPRGADALAGAQLGPQPGGSGPGAHGGPGSAHRHGVGDRGGGALVFSWPSPCWNFWPAGSTPRPGPACGRCCRVSWPSRRGWSWPGISSGAANLTGIPRPAC